MSDRKSRHRDQSFLSEIAEGRVPASVVQNDSNSDELFEIVDEDGKVVGKALRSECHGNPALIHRTAHVMVFHPDGRLLLQKRSLKKDIQPGKWDTAVGGHLMPGENFEDAAAREMAEELGIAARDRIEFVFDSKIRNDIESENTRVFKTVHAGPFKYPEDEIDELRFWTPAEIRDSLGTEAFTPNLSLEIERCFELNVFEGWKKD